MDDYNKNFDKEELKKNSKIDIKIEELKRIRKIFLVILRVKQYYIRNNLKII